MWLKKIIIAACVVQSASAELTEGLYAAFETSMGSFTCRLDAAEAPLTCANFVGLAEGSQYWMSSDGAVKSAPFYDGLIFHRVIDGFMIQGGDPLGTGAGGPGYAFPDQISTNLTHHAGGVLSMANSGPDSNGSQFFITLAPTTWLDGKHAVFGEVMDGMNVVSNIGAVAVDGNDRPLTNVVMDTIQILRVGSAAEAFDPADQPLPDVSPLHLSITNTLSGMEVVATTSSQCELTVYATTNLLDWEPSAQRYIPQAEGDWSVPASTNLNSEFFRGTRIFYPQVVDYSTFSEIENHTLSFTNETDSLIFTPMAGNAGTCSINGDSDSLVFWEDWTTRPYPGQVVFDSIMYLPFKFTLSPNGLCRGYYYNSGWNYMGEFIFTDTPPSP